MSYNSEKINLDDTLESVRKTNPLKPDEYVIIDGLSTDNTLEIVKEYSDIVTKVISGER